ncbi:hypothetical protein [Janibacter cremeus]|uniref:DUF559 domain-containing protein n=1 Tax=Janibacter cremeus TaxID=1285192 RepID=A0A852VUY7_9MICO|nr:hypothetical protein [Janibacter cremeus]NYF97371.1 hypothetical protein [Janibacter cremeus]
MPVRETAIERHRRVVAASRETGFVLDRRRLHELGVSRHQAAAQVAAGRWVRLGNQTFGMRDGPLGGCAQWWRAVWETGHRIALVDGASALLAAGLKGWTEDVVHVSVLHRHSIVPIDGVKIHKVARRVEDEAIGAGVPRTTPAVAAIRAAHWAVSDRQAATILAMPVQQRLTTAKQLMQTVEVVRGRTRRALIRQIVTDIADGAQSLGELDFAAACRRRGLPVPSRQVLHHGPRGRVYLDVYFDDYGFAVEIDGAGHLWGLAQMDDNLRENQLVIDGDRVLRITLIGLRLNEETVMDQVAAALRSDWAQDTYARRRR